MTYVIRACFALGNITQVSLGKPLGTARFAFAVWSHVVLLWCAQSLCVLLWALWKSCEIEQGTKTKQRQQQEVWSSVVLIQWPFHHILTASYSMCYFYQVFLSEFDPHSCFSLIFVYAPGGETVGFGAVHSALEMLVGATPTKYQLAGAPQTVAVTVGSAT